MLCCDNHVPSPVSRFTFPGRSLLILFLVLFVFAVQNCVKNLKNVSYACSSITSQVGTSNPRASRSRERPRLHRPSISPMYSLLLCRYNPVLGEFFRCRYDYPNGTQGFYIAEQGVYIICMRDHPPSPLLIRTYLFFISESHYPQVSHHPPISAFYYVSPANKLAIVGELRPKSKFLGNSVSTVMEGQSRITLMGRPEDSGKSIAYSSPFPPPPHEAKDAC